MVFSLNNSNTLANRFWWLPIFLILILAAALRLHYIEQPFIDVFSWRQASTAMMADNFLHRNPNILYPEVSWSGPGLSYQGREFQTITYIASLLYQVLGQHDWVGRGVAVIFGLWGIFALYQLTRRVWDEKHALATALMMAILPGTIFIERSFLPDPAMVALVVTSLWLLVAYLQTNRTYYLVLTALIGCLGFLTKIPGMLVGLPMLYATLAILQAKGELTWKRVSWMVLAGIVAFIPVVAYYLWARHLALTYPPYHFAGSGNWLWDEGLKTWIKQYFFLPNFYNVLLYWLWGLPGIALVTIGLLFPPPRPVLGQAESPAQYPFKAPWFFHLWLAGCIFYYFIGAQELVHNPWNFHIFNPVAAAFAGRALVLISTLAVSTVSGKVSFWGPTLRLGVILILTLSSSYYILRKFLYNSQFAYPSYQLGMALREVSKPQDLVVTMAEQIGDPVAIYYSRQRGWVFPPADEWAPKALPSDDKKSIKLLENLRAQSADWFGMVTRHYADIKANHPQFAQHITKTCRLRTQTEAYVIFEIRSPAEIAEQEHKFVPQPLTKE